MILQSDHPGSKLAKEWLNNHRDDLSTLAHELQKLSMAFMLSIMDEMMYVNDLAEPLAQVLSSPYNVSKIIQYAADYQERLIKSFIWLSHKKEHFVWDLVMSYCRLAAGLPDRPDTHPIAFDCMFELGSTLTEAGWYAEAIIMLKNAKHLAEPRAWLVLQVNTRLILAQCRSGRHLSASETSSELKYMVDNSPNLPREILANANLSLSICYFEQCKFEDSYHYARAALHLLDCTAKHSPVELIVNILLQTGKSYLGTMQIWRAKYVVKQAVSWAHDKCGKRSVLYAKALEDYAFYLLIMGAHNDAVKVAEKAKEILSSHFGHLCLRADLAQGNLSFRLLLEYYRLKSISNMSHFLVFATRFDNPEADLTVPDDRQQLAIKQMRPLVLVAINTYQLQMKNQFEKGLDLTQSKRFSL